MHLISTPISLVPVTSDPLVLFKVVCEWAIFVRMSPSYVLGPERRQTPRVAVAALTYIESDDNGGVVQNISENGMCVRVMIPIDAGETVRLWFMAEGRRVEVEAHIVWVDETRRTAGLSFKVLSPHPPDEIRKSICAPTTRAPSSQPLMLIGKVRRWLIDTLG